MLKLENIDVDFGSFKALKNINCEIEKKEFILIVGHNGSGKSTLFDLISGKLSPTSGSIYRNKQNITNLSEAKRALFVSRVFQNTHVGSVGALTVAENLALTTLKGKKAGFKSAIKNFPEYIVEEILKPLGLRMEELMNTPIGNLSGGQRQIITIIMATLGNPDVLLLDEPTAALDPASTENLLQFVYKFTQNKNMATLMITHDVQDAEFLCTRKWYLNKGELICN